MIRFHPFRRWVGLTLNGVSLGYMSHFNDRTELHLVKDAPAWLVMVRVSGPWEGLTACQNSVKLAESVHLVNPPMIVPESPLFT